MVAGAAHLHHLLAAPAGSRPALVPWRRGGDCEVRLLRLLAAEGAFSAAVLTRLREEVAPLFEALSAAAEGVPCDPYKDANPANWILAEGGARLVAVDFESDRRLPFLVDFINATEYAGLNLDDGQRRDLLALYLRVRGGLDTSWRRAVRDYELPLLAGLFGLYRHQEQMLHRLRDLGAAGGCHHRWHARAFRYHLRLARLHLAGLAGSPLTASLGRALGLYEAHFRVRFAKVLR
jgi:hypothetical protein